MLQAVLWDNDGVLVDTERLFFEITQAAFAKVGVELTAAHWAGSYLGAGRRTRDLAEELGLPVARIDPLLEARNAAYRQRLAGEIPIRPGVRETLTGLRRHVRQVMVTGSPGEQLRLMHQATGLLEFFEFMITDEDYERAKPHPDAYLGALRRLQVTPDRCLAVEDSPRGVSAAAAAGIRCVLVPHELTDVTACSAAYRIENDVRGVLRIVEHEQANAGPATGRE